MNERLKKLRKYLKLTQQEFADKIGMKRNTIANYETDRNEPSNSVISLICRAFFVNEEWLRTGHGEMFKDFTEEDEYFAAATEISNADDKLAMQAIIEYWKLDESSKQVFRNFILKLAEKSKE